MSVSEFSANLIRKHKLNIYHIQRLNAAKRLLEEGKYAYVCNAIHDESGQLTEYINTLLNGTYTVSSWLKSHQAIAVQIVEMQEPQFLEEMRKYRLRWIDHMISEIEEVLKQDQKLQEELL